MTVIVVSDTIRGEQPDHGVATSVSTLSNRRRDAPRSWASADAPLAGSRTARGRGKAA